MGRPAVPGLPVQLPHGSDPAFVQAATGCPSFISLPAPASKSQQPPLERMPRSDGTKEQYAVKEGVLTSLNLFQYLSFSYCETVLSHLSLSRKSPWLPLFVMISGCRLSTCRKHQAAITSTPDICKERSGGERRAAGGGSLGQRSSRGPELGLVAPHAPRQLLAAELAGPR